MKSFTIKVVTLSTISADSSISLAGVGVGVAGSWPWVVLVMMLLVLALLILVVYFRSKFVSLSYNIGCLYSRHRKSDICLHGAGRSGSPSKEGSATLCMDIIGFIIEQTIITRK